MDLYLGVDGGGSGCRAAVADAAGRVLGTGEGGAANIMSDPETARSNILQAMATALAQSGTGATPQALHAVLGLAGANIAEASGWLAARLPFASARIVGDAEIAARGALGPADGVTAAIGTGSIFAIQRAGHVRTLGGWGFRLGDQGGGARLGQALLETALLAHDGLLPRSPLLDAVVAEAGGPQGLVRFAAVATPADFATLAPRLFTAEAAGDAAATAILARAEAEIAAPIDLLLAEGVDRLCFLGGLGRIFGQRLARRYGALIQPALGTGLDGALAMAREAA
ncbi:MAG: BadF/BadG/BcrA/BcrD ATPase family protein [Amaricoccus sp.]